MFNVQKYIWKCANVRIMYEIAYRRIFVLEDHNFFDYRLNVNNNNALYKDLRKKALL